MPSIVSMPPINVDQTELARFGQEWLNSGEKLPRGGDYSSSQLGILFDNAVGTALAVMLGNIEIVTPNANHLMPEHPNCVEVGQVRIVGGVRPQNFDVGYRPDGVRFIFDSKTLNDTDSIRKNYQNMINDLATEATTVHTRFPYAVVGFMVILPSPALQPTQQSALIETLERLCSRSAPDEPHHLAEAVSMVVWNPHSGQICEDVPYPESILRLERFPEHVYSSYYNRYKGLPPHHGD